MISSRQSCIYTQDTKTIQPAVFSYVVIFGSVLDLVIHHQRESLPSTNVVEGYFSNILHELALSPSVVAMVTENTLYTATRASCAPEMVQSAFASMLLTGATGNTARFHATHNHPWSHFTDAPLLQCVSVFQAAILAVPKESPIHPSKIETSIAW